MAQYHMRKNRSKFGVNESVTHRPGGFRAQMDELDRRRWTISSVPALATMQDLSGQSEVSGPRGGLSELSRSTQSGETVASQAQVRQSNAAARISNAFSSRRASTSAKHNAILLGLLVGDEDWEEDPNEEKKLDDKSEASNNMDKSAKSNHSRREDLGAGLDEEETAVYDFDPEFESKFEPTDMRCLALVAHNHMKPAMKEFVLANRNLLKKFMLTGTNTTMTMLREVFGDDPKVVYGPTCTSGPLGGDAELVSVMVTERLGGCIFFTDPMSAHPHSADIECLNRQANVHNIIMCPNPTTAMALMATFRVALKEGMPELMPSFFETLASPSVAAYKQMQSAVLQKNMAK